MWLLQNEPEFRFLEKLTEAKGRRSQNWERAGSDRLGKQGLEEFKALQADSDDCELAIRFDKHSAKMGVRCRCNRGLLPIGPIGQHSYIMHSCMSHIRPAPTIQLRAVNRLSSTLLAKLQQLLERGCSREGMCLTS